MASPSDVLARNELTAQLHQALESMDPMDREVLALRHFEELTHAEAARVLEIQEAAAARRYVRALQQLKDVLATL